MQEAPLDILAKSLHLRAERSLKQVGYVTFHNKTYKRREQVD